MKSWASRIIRKSRWLPAVSTAICAYIFVASAIKGAFLAWMLGSAALLVASSYIWGYATRAMRGVLWPSLLNLPRRQYGEVWDGLAVSPALARAAASGHSDEKALRRSARTPVKNLTELAGVLPEDDVLEFGCGVARIGLELAPHCHTWTGADLSANMLTVAEERLHQVSNVRLVKLRHTGLDEFSPNSFDLVYSTNMLDHLDQMDRWRYVKDAFRVLRPEGRLYIDNIDLESEEGWAAFSRGAESSQELERPPYLATPSTAAELTVYAVRAGFTNVVAHKRSPIVIITGIKPAIGKA